MNPPKDYKKILNDSEKSKEYEFIEQPGKGITPVLCRHKACGHEWKVAPYELLVRGRGCPVCALQQRSINSRNDTEWYIEEVRKYDVDYMVLGEYTGTHDNILHKCRICSGEFLAQPTNLLYSIKKKKKHYCPNCNNIRLRKEKSLGVENFITQLKVLFDGKIPYEFDKDEFTILDNKMTFTCKKCQHTFMTTPNNILHPKGNFVCPKCNKMVRDLRDYKTRCLEASNQKILPLTEYINRETPILHRCLVCEKEWLSKPANRLSGQGCPYCANKVTRSRQELELEEYIRSIYGGELVLNSRKLLGNRQEIDVYIPEFKIGFEIHGLYFHNAAKKGRKYHQDKMLAAEAVGIRLIQIFQDEWSEKQELVKNKIAHLLGLHTDLPKLFARKCTIAEISSKDKNSFLDTYHLQGADKSCLNLGLFYNDTLVAVMTFTVPRICMGQKHPKPDVYELSRYCTDNSVLVVGGFGKLLKHFMNEYIVNSIYTYADLRWSVGKLYLDSGFTLVGRTAPNYFYFHNTKDNFKRLHRYQFRKSNLQKLFPKIYKDTLSESEIMTLAGYKRVYDAGHLKFELNI